ncbi:endo-1,4-beta-xylanase [Alkalicoccus chagannorensis]|uniref:endo-1,4-beta-xylanase n=1 Tax=Alkalicoccus chagannorensis TaxID=427072 RepID=UPI00042A18D9|nr:endo-1,4-beta-xylanase [Alkalicoccus chagannorensis]
MKKAWLSAAVLAVFVPAGFAAADEEPQELEGGALDAAPMKDRFEDSFNIGAAIEPHQTEGTHGEVLAHHYNSLTAENVMKPENLQPEEGEFYWDDADRLVDFANEHDMDLRFHTLLWHNQVPDWFFEDEDGNYMAEEEDEAKREENKELLLERLETHIHTVVERYKDDVDAWDVVNEVISDAEEPTDEDGFGLRDDTPWYQITGDEYIKTAFRAAREAGGEDALLFINDYNTEIEPKRDHLHGYIEHLLEEGVPVDGIGHQAHIQLEWPTLQEMRESFEMFDDLGLVTHITELDVSLYEYPPITDNETYDDISDEEFASQAERYYELFSLYENLDHIIDSLTFWGIGDDHTWLNDRAEEANDGVGKDGPFVFDTDLNVKPAYAQMMREDILTLDELMALEEEEEEDAPDEEAPEEEVPSVSFTDIDSSHPYYHVVERMAGASVIEGYPDGSFRPDEPVQRLHTALLLQRDLGLGTSDSHGFQDVAADHPDAGALGAVEDAGIFSGDHRGYFHPVDPITRGEAAAVLSRAYGISGSDTHTFSDMEGHQFESAVAGLAQAGVVSGRTETTFDPDADVTRLEFAMLMDRIHQDD